MKISKTQALNYVTQSTYFFPTRMDRNNALGADNIATGTTVAVAEDAYVDMDDMENPLWSIEKFNGANWVLESLDSNYSLIVTDEGLKALSDMASGRYVFEISCIKVKRNNIVNPSDPLTSWTDADFIQENDIVLSTEYDDDNFSLTNRKTLTWRKSIGNSGIQFTLLIDSDTYGYLDRSKVGEYTIGAVGLYVKDQRTQDSKNILFAIGNLSELINKYSTTPQRVGNAVKLYFNLALSNLGNIANIMSTPEDVHSIPEVASDTDLETRTATYPSTVYPYNVYLVDNYQKTNAPAIAVRTSAGTSIDESGLNYNWKWTYLTPVDDTITVDSSKFDSSCKDYMVVAWDETTGKFKPADGDKFIDEETESSSVQSVLTGIKINNTISFAGNIRNFLMKYKYTAHLSEVNKGADYRTGDILTATPGTTQFFCLVSNVVDDTMAIDKISDISPNTGNEEINTTYDYWYCDRRRDSSPDYPKSKVARIAVTSQNVLNNSFQWNFPSNQSVAAKNWLNKPLYVDIKHPYSTQEQKTAFANYCTSIGLDAAKEASETGGDRRGRFTTKETECFVGWCTGVGVGSSSIKLALDLRNNASETDYGTTRYASESEVRNVKNNLATSEITSVVPKLLKQNFFQITRPTGEASDNINKDGRDRDHAIEIDTYTKFNHSIECTGTDLDGVAFKGTAYRAKWADLAEFYESDAIYPAGTLITIGSGMKEITIATKECNGIISDKPGYELGEKATANHLPVALVGKVPVMFDKKSIPHFGDRIYLSRFEDGRASIENNGFCLGKVIDRRPNLEKYKTVLCSVRISF